MTMDEGRQYHEATEASPLLRPVRSNGDDGATHASGGGNGTLTGHPTPGSSNTAVGADEEGREPLPTGNGGDEVTREGIPEMAKRLHILLPAIGIGIFLCALDQLLAVATVSILDSRSFVVTNPWWMRDVSQSSYGLLCTLEGGAVSLGRLEACRWMV